jgi:tetratricopeptide (TPR) repeat protein
MMRLMALFVSCLLFLGVSITHADTAQYPCHDLSGYLAPRLQAGQAARILTIALNMRPAPTTQQARITQLSPSTTVQVLDGPACNQGFVWWQVALGDQIGWIAEGTNDDTPTYWTEPRGDIITLTPEDNIPRYYVQIGDGLYEPEGCMRPPDNYNRVQLGYATLNQRTLFMLDNASRIYRDWGGIYSFRDLLTQGSYNPGGVDASFGTHDGGGAVDISVRSRVDWSIMWAEIPYMLEALRIAGFSAWVREQGELYPNSGIHIHAIAVGDAELSPIARAQVDGERGYLRGYNGLPESYGLPILDGWGEPIFCAWMADDEIYDLRASDYYLQIADQYIEAQNFEGALLQLSRAIEIFPEEASLYSERASIYQALNRLEEAGDDLETYLTLTEGA